MYNSKIISFKETIQQCDVKFFAFVGIGLPS